MSSIPVWYGLISTLGPLGGGLVGYWFSGRNDEARDKRAADRDQAAKRLDRDIARDTWSHEFQRDLYLDLQDQLQRLVRSTFQQIKADQHTLEATGKMTSLPDGMSDEAFGLTIELNRVRQRILDDDIRQAVSDFYDESVRLSMEAPLEWGVMKNQDPAYLLNIAKRNEQQLAASYAELTKKLGAALRKEIGPSPVA